MNDQTAKLIESLAAKLGTTAEYLWEVLVKQAYVQATYSLIWLIVAVAYVIGFIFIARAICKKEKQRRDAYKSQYESLLLYDWSAENVIIMVASSIAAIVAFIAIICMPGDIITGFLNPEYWALQQILKQI